MSEFSPSNSPSKEQQEQQQEELSAIQASVLEQQNVALQMRREGFTNSEIATALGYEASQIETLLADRVEVGTPEEILQGCLRTIVSLVPLAEAQYRIAPILFNAQALNSFIDTTKSLISDIYNLKSKEDTYRILVQRVLEPFCRETVKGMLSEVSTLKERLDGNNLKDLEKFAVNMGKRFEEALRKSKEDLGDVLGVGADARARINLGLVGDEKE